MQETIKEMKETLEAKERQVQNLEKTMNGQRRSDEV